MTEEEIQALEDSLDSGDKAMLDELADGIARRRLISAALFFLESVKPLGFVGSQMMIFLRPMLQVIWSDPVRYDRLRKILEKRGSIELLLRRLEART